jgi:hypothetical protein
VILFFTNYDTVAPIANSAGGWFWFVLREKSTSGWFVLRKKYCWLVSERRKVPVAGFTE